MEDSVPLKSAHLLTDFLPVRDYYQNWNIQVMLTIIYWIFILHLTDFFDSYGMYLQDICPVVLNTTLQHEKKKEKTTYIYISIHIYPYIYIHIYPRHQKCIYCISFYMISESYCRRRNFTVNSSTYNY